jgi:hypothetical protein
VSNPLPTGAPAQPGRTLKKDYYAGALMVLVGVAAAWVGAGYHVGELARMGPGFFPLAIGVLLAMVGVLIALNADDETAEPAAGGHAVHSLPDVRGAVCLVGGMAAFWLFGHYGGLLPATFAITFVSALGDRQNTLAQAAALALAMVAVAALVFHWGLQLQLPLLRWGA